MIFVDADSCPVTDQIIKIAGEYNERVTLVKSYAHYSLKPLPEHVKVIYVDQEKEASDYRIMRLLTRSDHLITADYGLASLALAKASCIIHPKGFVYKKDTIEQLLQSRYLSSQVRKSGGRMKGPKPYSDEDRQLFTATFTQLLDCL